MASDMITSSEIPSPIMKVMVHSSTAASSSSSSGTANAAFADDRFEDGCSICLEPFTSTDPPTVTSCKHEYHLQCILEWAQRSKECPNCWQLFVLENPTSQELLAAVESESNMRSTSNVRIVHQEQDINNQDAHYVDDSGFEERILQHFAAAKDIAHLVNRRRRQASSGLGPSQVFPSMSVRSMSNMPQTHGIHEECNRMNYGLDVGLPSTGTPASAIEPESSQVLLSSENRNSPAKHRIFVGQPSPDSPQRSSSSELLGFSESVKAKLSAASARYKESISKSTLCFKEKLLAKNGSVKELSREVSREVKREVSAGIAGVARMIERFDLSAKRMGVTIPLSSCSAETSNLAHEVKDEVEIIPTHLPDAISRETGHAMSSDIFPSNSATIPCQLEISQSQRKI